jgi:hypothetical protein
MFQEDRQSYTASDVRFTCKGDTLYAIFLGWPKGAAGQPGKAVIKALAADSPFVTGSRLKVQLLGAKGNLRFRRTAQGLEITLPPQAPTKYAVAFKMTGFKTTADVSAATLAQWRKRLMPGPDKSVKAGADGSLLLPPDKAELHGAVRVQGEGDARNIGFWDNARDFLSWDEVNVAQPGTYRVEVQAATTHPSSDFVVDVNGQKLPVHLKTTGGWENFQAVNAGTVQLKSAGTIAVKLTAVEAGWHPANIRSVRLSRSTAP